MHTAMTVDLSRKSRRVQLPPDDTKQVLHDEHEVIRVARARLEIEMLVEGFGVIVLGASSR